MSDKNMNEPTETMIDSVGWIRSRLPTADDAYYGPNESWHGIVRIASINFVLDGEPGIAALHWKQVVPGQPWSRWGYTVGKYKGFYDSKENDLSLISEYNAELFKETGSAIHFTLKQLIQHSREYRKLNKQVHNEFFKLNKEGYDAGYKRGLSQLMENTISINELCKMSIQDLVNIIGADY